MWGIHIYLLHNYVLQAMLKKKRSSLVNYFSIFKHNVVKAAVNE